MKWIKIVLFVSLISNPQLYAQIDLNDNTKANIRELAESLRQKLLQQKNEAIEYASRNNYKIRSLLPNGQVIELMRLLDGFPVYYKTGSLDAAQTVSTDLVWSEGITGNGMLVGEWDGGDVRATHQEFGGRVVDGDGADGVIGHATMVGGILIASGMDADARGMASTATLHAYEWTSDKAEMAAAAANDGLLVSNHSYGPVGGWYNGDPFGMGDGWYWFGDIAVDETESVYFGWYGNGAHDVDDLAYTAPYYLTVWAGGNDRGEGPDGAVDHYAWDSSAGTSGQWVWVEGVSRPKDGQYDCLVGEVVAKNVLVVGGVDDIPGGYTQPSDVVMSSFSCWGPTDDGRIKPDLVGNGIGIYSAYSTSDNAYAAGDGTSFASPNVTGSLALLQEYYHSTHNPDWMKSATLKAVAIHTADEAGDDPGPDYEFGWGLLNTKSAYDLIQQDASQSHIIQELSLNDGESLSLDYFASGNEAIKVTTVWTDPAATVFDPVQLDDPTPRLVNDLDIRLQNAATTFQPWILDRDNPANAAGRGDNAVDNVEQVYIAAPDAGLYSIEISHKGTLTNGSQDFALVISGLSDMDFGDAPDSPYPTLLSSDGARHQVDDVTFLGSRVDTEFDGTPNAQSLGDDISGSEDDEDGVVFDTAIIPGTQAGITVIASVAGKLNAWIDFDDNGVWEGDEQIFTDEDLVSGNNSLTFSVPADAVLDVTYARFRFDLAGGLATTGLASAGEVEDYQVSIQSSGDADFDLDMVSNADEGESDRDGDGVPNYLDYDPTGYFYDESSGEIITGGQISVDPSAPVTLLHDGSDGYYQFYTDGTAGTYTLQVTPPPNYELSSSCAESSAPFDPSGLSNPVALGSGELGSSGFLANSDCATNTYYFSFDLETGDPNIINNNIPLNYLIPIELSSFTATCLNGRVELEWITQSETENMGFHLFRSDAFSKGFERLNVNLIPGQGNSQSRHKYVYTDKDVVNGKTYYYKLADIDYHGRMTMHDPVSITVKAPDMFSLQQNYPNPFNPTTTISYSLPRSGMCRLIIYNINGQAVKTLVSKVQQAGSHQVVWDGYDSYGHLLPSGIYLYRLLFGNQTKTRKMYFLK